MSMSFLCNGNVTPSRFVKLDSSTTGGNVIQCVGSDRPIGVSQPGTRNPPTVGLDDGFAGVAGINEITVYTETDECWLEVGAAVSLGDYLKPNGSGQGITASADGDQYGATALQSATAATQLIRVKILIGYRGA